MTSHYNLRNTVSRQQHYAKHGKALASQKLTQQITSKKVKAVKNRDKDGKFSIEYLENAKITGCIEEHEFSEIIKELLFLRNENQSLSNELEEVDDQYEELRNEYVAFKNSHPVNEVAILKNEIRVLQDENMQLQVDISDVDQDFYTISNERDRLVKEIASLKKQSKNNLQSKLEDCEYKYSRLQGMYSKSLEENVQLDKQNKQIVKDYEQLSKQKDQLAKENVLHIHGSQKKQTVIIAQLHRDQRVKIPTYCGKYMNRFVTRANRNVLLHENVHMQSGTEFVKNSQKFVVQGFDYANKVWGYLNNQKNVSCWSFRNFDDFFDNGWTCVYLVQRNY